MLSAPRKLILFAIGPQREYTPPLTGQHYPYEFIMGHSKEETHHIAARTCRDCTHPARVSCVHPYSPRNATAGSSLLACRTGIEAASSVILRKNSATPAYIAGDAATSVSVSDRMVLLAAKPRPRPAARPAVT